MNIIIFQHVFYFNTYPYKQNAIKLFITISYALLCIHFQFQRIILHHHSKAFPNFSINFTSSTVF